MTQVRTKAQLLSDYAGAETLALKFQDLIESLFAGAALSPSPSLGIGYIAGAGAAIVQITSRATTVIINAICGKITTTADSLAAATIVTFTVTNSAVAATDTIILSKVSGDVDTHCWVDSVAAGSFTISLRNTHASAADVTAFVMNFAVIKSVIA